MIIPVVTRIPIDALTFRAEDAKIGFKWDEWRERWDAWEYDTCSLCGHLTTSSGECDNEECEYYEQTVTSSLADPIMNWYYPFEAPDDFDPDEAAKLITDLPLCVVLIDEEDYGLALTGGGEDFSWQIAEAFTRLGMVPPQFLRLPMMADKQLNERTDYIMRAMERAYEAARLHIENDQRDLRHLRDRLEEQAGQAIN